MEKSIEEKETLPNCTNASTCGGFITPYEKPIFSANIDFDVEVLHFELGNFEDEGGEELSCINFGGRSSEKEGMSERFEESQGSTSENESSYSPSKPTVIRRARTKRAPRRGGPFDRVIEVLKRWYEDPSTAFDLEEFSNFELELAVAFIRRKVPVSKDNESTDPRETLLECFVEPTYRSTKRTEENNKFILKHGLKLLRKQFLEGDASPDPHRRFFEHFFPDTQLVTHGPNFRKLNFNDPNGSLPKSKVKKIMKIPKFSESLLEILRTDELGLSPFIRFYQSSISKKLQKVFAKWKHRPLIEARKDTLAYFKSNTQCKLPWTNREILVASQKLFSITHQ